MDIQKLLLTQSMFSRPGKKRESAKGIAIHWVTNAGISAVANRNYFESLKNQSPNDPAAPVSSKTNQGCVFNLQA
jgi:N-acetylmuramoyl-L-alanine amidase CwlA